MQVLISRLSECEGILAFKEVNVKNKDVIVPDINQ